jgi:hypothetical protein
LNASPCSFAKIIVSKSAGRGKLPTWVVSIRCVLFFISVSLVAAQA